MTLIEVLLSVAITVLVVTLVLSVYHTVTVTLRSQQERQAGAGAAADALTLIARDVSCTFVAWRDNATAFALSPSEDAQRPDSDLSFCTSIVPDGETDLRWCELEQVAYRVTTDPRQERTLIRANRPLAGPGAASAPVTNVLATGIEQFRVTVYDGTNWIASWPAAGSPICPRAARIEIRARQATGTRDLQTEVFIPAGNVITSSLVRVAGGKP